MKKIIFSAVVSGVLGVASTVSAQNPAASQQADAWRFRESLQGGTVSTNAAPEFYGGETSDVGPQTLLELKQRRQYIRAFGDEQYFYSDNIFLSDKGQRGADVLVSTLQVALAPDAYDFLGGKIAPEIGYEHQWFSYGLLSNEKVQIAVFPPPAHIVMTSIGAFDFNVQTVFGGATWRWHNWDVSLGTDFRRFLDSGNYNEFYREIVPHWGAAYTFQIAADKSVTVGYEGDYRFTRTQNPFPGYQDDFNDRLDQSLVAVGNWQVCPHTIVQPFYRLQYSCFQHAPPKRRDLLNSIGIALEFPFTQNIALRTFISYDMMHTDGQHAQSYDKFDAGAGVHLALRF